MKNMIKKLLPILFVSLSMGSSVQALDGIPYDAVGTIQQIRAENNEVFIDNQKFLVSTEDLSIYHNGSTAENGLNYLQEGQSIGYKVELKLRGNTITKIWLLE